jgi:type I site-specific restriction endonuclease
MVIRRPISANTRQTSSISSSSTNAIAAARNWRGILDYFAPAVQLGLTATPKRKDNENTYTYFGEPVYVYSLKEGINDGFLTPFKVKQISTTLDEYVYTPDDKLVEGEIESGRRYTEPDFNKIIEIKEREAHRVKLFMEQINQNEKTLAMFDIWSPNPLIFLHRVWRSVTT